MYADNKNVINRGIYTALSSFSFSYLGKKMTISADLPTLDPTRLTVLSAQDAVTGVNGIYTSASEGSPVIGTTYTMSLGFVIPGGGQPNNFKITAVAATTSFSDLADTFVTNINAMNAAGVDPLPATGSNSGGHLRVTEAPLTNYGAGEFKVAPLGLISDPNGVALNASWTISTANVLPIGQYAALQREYLKSTGTPSFASAASPDSRWFGSAPISTSTYYVLTVSNAPVSLPNSDANAYNTWLIYVDKAISGTTTTTAYIAGVINNYANKAGINSDAGSGVPVVAITTTAAGTAIIPKGVNLVNVTSANSGYFAAIQAGLPAGSQIAVTVGSNGFKLIPDTTEGINGSAPGAGKSSAVAANQTVLLTKTTATNWFALGWLSDGTDKAAIPAAS